MLRTILPALLYSIVLHLSPTLQDMNHHLLEVTFPTLLRDLRRLHHVPAVVPVVDLLPKPVVPHWATVYLDELDAHDSQLPVLHFAVPAWTLEQNITFIEDQAAPAPPVLSVAVVFTVAATALLLALAVYQWSVFILTKQNLFRLFDSLFPFDEAAPIAPKDSSSSVGHTFLHAADKEVIEIVREDPELDVVVDCILYEPALLAPFLPVYHQPLLPEVRLLAPAPAPAVIPAPPPAPILQSIQPGQRDIPAKARSQQNRTVRAQPTKQRANGTRIIGGGVMLGIPRERCHW